MKTHLRTAGTCIVSILLSAMIARAEEKNGLSVTVGKVTLAKNDSTSYSESKGHYEVLNRTEGLKVTIKNTSFKPMPEGELEWKIVVVGAYSSQLYDGIEKVKALVPANIQELTVGSAKVTGWRKGMSKGEDKLEWQLAVKQGETEILKMQSTPNFDGLAKKAHKVPEGGEVKKN